MKRVLRLGCLIAVAICIADCSDDIGGPCSYVEYPGSATIISVEQDTSQMRLCENGALIQFTFQPTDSSASGRYRFSNRPDTNQTFIVGSGCSAPLNWAISQGLVVGSGHRCVRCEMTDGTCSPVVFRFPDINYSAWGDSCEVRN